jgi:DNA mismatch repair protein MutS
MPKDPWQTPAMRQWTAIKEQHPDCVLFFRMGDFYELFGDDAVNLSRDLGLSLTNRNNSIPFAGVPHHQKSVYLQRALEAGYRVAVVDQLEDPKQAKGVVDRGVTQVVTPGTLVDESLLQDGLTIPLAAVVFDSETQAGIAIVELSTGAFSVFDGSPEQCADELARAGVRELLYAAPASGEPPIRVTELAKKANASLTKRAGWQFRIDEAIEAIHEQFDVSTLDGFGLDKSMPCVRAAGATVRYLRETQAIDREQSEATSGSEFQRQSATLRHLAAPALIDRSSACLIDATSLRSLEINQTIREASLSGSLAGVFLAAETGTRCVLHTPMGKRLIRDWLSAPRTDRSVIEARHDAVGALTNDRTLSASLADLLSDICDIARVTARVALGRATPRDIAALGSSAARVRTLAQTIEQCEPLARYRSRLQQIESSLLPVAQSIVDSCVDEPPAHLRAGGLIRDGIDSELDEARNLERDAGAWLADYQSKLIETHDLPSMKVGYTKVFGYYIELPRGQAARAPVEFTRKQTLKNAERYITPELKEFEEKVLSASSRAIEREHALFDKLCAQTRAIIDELSAFSAIVAELDALLGFATKAHERSWTRPTITDDNTLEIHAGRHPVLDETLGHRFVPNDCTLATDPEPNTLALITGPNMAGKSTYIRQNALLVVLAQAGSFIPADRATIGICSRIFTRVGADDALHRGQSTFMVEMIETANILNNATPDALVILDEIGRGTSTLDGLSLAWAISEHLAMTTPRTLFATHYHEITELEERLSGRVKNLHVAVREWTTEDGKQEIAFLHSIRPGKADQSYGIHVAQLAGVPKTVTQRAHEILGALSVEHAGRVDTQAVHSPSAPSKNDQLGLFTEFVAHPAVDELRELKLESMSPLEAFDTLRKLKAQAAPDP